MDMPEEELGPSYVNFAVVASIAAERIGELKRAIAAVPDTKIIYIRIAGGRLRIVEEKLLNEANTGLPVGIRCKERDDPERGH